MWLFYSLLVVPGSRMSKTKAKLSLNIRWLFSARNLRWGAVALSLAGMLYLATWLAQRSFSTPVKKQAMRSWLDNALNADVSLLGDMLVRFNIVRDSRVVLHNVEIEHPNPLFPGKLAAIRRMGAWVPPWSVTGLVSGDMDLLFQDMRLEFEQNSSGEWSHDGIMQPLASGDAPFPFPFPKINRWNAEIRNCNLTIRRRGYELNVSVLADIFGRRGRDNIGVHADSLPFTFGSAEGGEPFSGRAGPLDLRVKLGEERGSLPIPIPGDCRVTVASLPVSSLPFFVGGIPMEDSPGTFHGLIRYDKHDQAEGALHIEGELNDVPLAVFGLPRRAPLRLSWPVGPKPGGNLQARLHMGPSGFGAFEIAIPLDDDGRPKLLSMRGDVAVLDAVPAFFTTYSQWPHWLSLTFPGIEWRSGRWRGFGWEGNNLQLALSRSTGGLNLNGEAEMLGGRVRISMTPDQPANPITVAAERLDAAQFAEKLSRLMPETFRARIRGSHVNLTWRGYPNQKGDIDEWGTGMVWAKPSISVAGSGGWWRGMSHITKAIADALPEWGGGDSAELLALAERRTIDLDQLSIVSEKGDDGAMAVEFRAYGESFGQATGLFELRRDGTVEGEFLLAGMSDVLRAVGRANPDLALTLELLANDSPGLRVAFRQEPGEEMIFYFPFLHDAGLVRDALLRTGESGQ